MHFLKKWFKDLIFEEGRLTELFRGASISFFMKLAGLACAQLFALVVARLLGADAFGIFSLSISLLTICSVLAVAGLDIGLVRFIAVDNARKNKEAISSNYISALTIVVPVSLIVSLFSWHYASFIAVNIFHNPDLTGHFKIASYGILPLALINLNSQGLRGFKEIPKFTFIRFVSRYLFGLILIIPLYFFIYSDNKAAITSYTIALAIIAFLSFYWIAAKIDLKNININRKRYKGILAVSLPLMLASSLLLIKGWVDTLMLGYFMESSSVGIYNIALKLAALVSLILTAVNMIAAPKFAEAYGNNDEKELNKVIQKATRLIFWGSLPIFFILILFPDLILLIFGKEFQAAGTALMILSVGYLVNSISGSIGYIMQMTGKQIAFQNITLISAILGVVLNYLLIPVWGINGAAFSTTVGLIFYNITCAAYLKIRYSITSYYNPFTEVTSQ